LHELEFGGGTGLQAGEKMAEKKWALEGAEKVLRDISWT
jgi:hypothetical protein